MVSAIKESDLHKDMYELAANKFRGCKAGTLDEIKVPDKAKEAGMKPAGDNGAFFQFFEMYRHQITPQSSFNIGHKPLTLRNDFLVAEPVNASVNTEIIYAGNTQSPKTFLSLILKEKSLPQTLLIKILRKKCPFCQKIFRFCAEKVL